MTDNGLKISSQLFIPFDEYRLPSAPAMTSQVKGNRSIPGFRKVTSNVNIPSRIVSMPIDQKYAFAGNPVAIPNPAKQSDAILSLNRPGSILCDIHEAIGNLSNRSSQADIGLSRLERQLGNPRFINLAESDMDHAIILAFGRLQQRKIQSLPACQLK